LRFVSPVDDTAMEGASVVVIPILRCAIPALQFALAAVRA